MRLLRLLAITLMIAAGSAAAAVTDRIFSDGFDLVANIMHPSDGDVRSVGVSIAFIGSAIDDLDGTLTGPALVWTSSLDGQIGTGTSFSASLSAGQHTITLTATNSRGNIAKTTISLMIQ